ncbi:hypothetical protein [Stenotrophomonas sp. SY1]|jgi:hypothetical protein|uniref:hypothetical protein n=1 Tax=Stenotrophomonas sp. SY1 TaxID=477235 RepID=UPI001E29B32E|nr:hypothetical protein [Stenotrophomonas sp. SY1]MCD9086856.1 hypothetical protein [Stenotrophomonas sp. SY1]
MRILGWMAVLAAMSGWSAWFVICNVYEFSLPLDPWALAFGWLITLVACVQSLRSAHRRAWGWGLCGLASCFGMYLLLVHRGLGHGAALAVLVVVALGVFALTMKVARRSRVQAP